MDNTANAVDGAPFVHGAAGAQRFAVVTGSQLAVYRRSDCVRIGAVASLENFFGVGPSELFIRPRILYDPTVKRFLLVAVSELGDEQTLYVAVSKTQHPTADVSNWHRYSYALGLSASSPLCDHSTDEGFILLGVGRSQSRWFITANSGEFDTGVIISLDKPPGLGGTRPNAKCFDDLPYGRIAATIVEGGGSTAYFVAAVEGNGNVVGRYQLSTAGQVSGDTVSPLATIDVDDWVKPQGAEQPNGQRLATPTAFQSASIQRGTAIWNVHTVDVGGFARLRLYKFSTTGAAPLRIFKPSTGATHHNFNASLALSDTGDKLFITFNRTAPSSTTGGRPAMVMGTHSAATAAGAWAFNVVQVSSFNFATAFSNPCNNLSNFCRWSGTATQVDPLAGDQAWGFIQLTNGTDQNNWRTRAARAQ